MTDEEFQALIHRPQSDYDEEKIEYYRVMQEWDVFRRRHNANVFDVFFHDVQDEIGQGEVKDIVVDISARLGVAMPVIHDDAEALAYIKNKKKDDGEDFSLFYNWDLLKRAGFNNKDAFTAVMVHEMTHKYLIDRTLCLCSNEHWSQELACDYMTGIFAQEKGLATGKYKWAVGRMHGADSHPPGWIRGKVVEHAMDYYQRMIERKKTVTVRNSLAGFNAFMLLNGREIESEISKCRT
jgi:hypothetical protein